MTAERHLKVMPTYLDAAPDEIAREIAIEAPADLVFAYFTDPTRHVRWQGVEAELDPQPGGHLRVTFAPGHVAVGTYLEVEPPTRLVYTWGWEQEGSDVLPPGASTVEVNLRPTARGTVVRVVHAGLPDAMLQLHSHGWDECLTELHGTITAACSSGIL